MVSLILVFNHLVLPAELPKCVDEDPEAVSSAILHRVLEACKVMEGMVGGELYRGELATIWSSIRRTLQKCRGIRGMDIEARVLLQDWADFKMNDFHLLHVAKQNAALIVRRTDIDGSESIVFEGFETSPAAKSVLATDGALICDFPERAAKVSWAKFCETPFQGSLAMFLEQAGQESLQRFAATATKAGTSIIEARDTTDPALILEFLMSLLAATGTTANVSTIRKRVRDDVHIRKAEIPWRRAPAWLALRVVLLRQLCLTMGVECGKVCYKVLICVVLANLLEESAGELAPELVLTLRAKLCRRLAKLEADRKNASESRDDNYGQLFASISALCERVVLNVTGQIENAWDRYKRSCSRNVPRIASRAAGNALVISLPVGGQHLRSLLHDTATFSWNRNALQVSELDDGTVRATREMSQAYFAFAKIDSETENGTRVTVAPDRTYIDRCVQLANAIDSLFASAYDHCKSKPEQMSSFILNMFEIWIAMDKCAVAACPVLTEFHPLFPPAALDVLLLSTAVEMKRLQAVQIYLGDRCEGCSAGERTIFAEPSKHSFATRYLQLSDEAQQLHDVQDRIDLASDASRARKQTEWQRMNDQYDNLSAKISGGTCVCTRKTDGSRDVRGCTKCYHWRTRNRMKINIHEDYLPSQKSQKAAVVFELCVPKHVQAYRNATWRIFRELAHPSKGDKHFPAVLLLNECGPLQPYSRSDPSGITLASAKKSFLQTHYKAFKMKVDVDKIVLPFAASFSYYDQRSETWVGDLQRPITFVHHCGVHIPPCLLQSVTERLDHPPPKFDGPTSYESIANQTKCPPEISVHEFTAFQRLLAGTNRRWLTILVELGSSNLNFSTEDTMLLLGHLATQAGPMGSKDDFLRNAHVVFKDESFCRRLAEQIEKRLQSLKSNWRETNCMELLLTLALRLYELTNGLMRNAALDIVAVARHITLGWVSRLRDEVRKAEDAPTAMRLASYGFWAALLCRRTFTIFNVGDTIDAANLSTFIQSSIALQENLITNPSKLSPTVTSMLMRDIRMVYRIQSVIQHSIMIHTTSLEDAIRKCWSESETSSARTFSSWVFLSSPHETWVGAVMTSSVKDWVLQQIIHYNVLEGHLLVDGVLLGKLPPEIVESKEVKQLFGNQHLLTFPSSLTGMSHMLVMQVFGNEIHFGRRGDAVVIRAVGYGAVLEYIPGSLFRMGAEYDLPASLIDGCTHWLNLRTGQLEIRRSPYLWKTRLGDWVLNLYSGQARRRDSVLVDPHSQIHQQIQEIFRDFEDPQELTVYQPAKRSLSVELKRMELSFFVDESGLLECRQLRAVIDPDQDAGTLYGLRSKLVMHDLIDKERRSLLVALGSLSFRRHGMHVEIQVHGVGEYGKFEIDTILGRLTCPPEPRLLYTKALLHAATSFPLSDPLTSCTGTEVACHLLESGVCQPWKPLTPAHKSILESIAALSPTRAYYPADMKILQTVGWNPDLTVTIQHDCFTPLVGRIFSEAARLLTFYDEKGGLEGVEHAEKGVSGELCSEHLRRRGLIRRNLYERPVTTSLCIRSQDHPYERRNWTCVTQQEQNVYNVTRLLHRRPIVIDVRTSFTHILEDLPGTVIGGFPSRLDEFQGVLSDWIDNTLSERWGQLVNFCRTSHTDDIYKVAFRLSLLAFSPAANMEAIKLLCAFTSVETLKTLEPPTHSVFIEFTVNPTMTGKRLRKLIRTHCALSEPKQRGTSNSLSLVEAADARLVEIERLANHLLEQWPCDKPSTSGFRYEFLKDREVMEHVGPEWTRVFANLGLLTYANAVQEILDTQALVVDLPRLENWCMVDRVAEKERRGDVVPSLQNELLLNPAPDLSKYCTIISDLVYRTVRAQETSSADTTNSRSVTELDGILSAFTSSPHPLWQQYGKDLRRSLDALRQSHTRTRQVVSLPTLYVVQNRVAIAREAVRGHFEEILHMFAAGDGHFHWLSLGELWPRITTTLVLEQLRSSSDRSFGSGTREFLVSYGVLITRLQWLLRARYECLKGDGHRLLEEWSEAGHENWNPSEVPDWLLLEIDSNLLIRSEQIDVAEAIISPMSSSNSVLQLNMGKGKTSCIVPMALMVLANTKQLSRLIVPKALLLQTAQTLQAKIGGLVGREIRHIPFSRRTRTPSQVLKLYSDIHRQMLDLSGIILTIPEHILSFKLSGLQRLADSKFKEAGTMITFQDWLEKHSRDVLDESDFSLAVKTQLIYPSGQLLPVDGHPDRWIIAQSLLHLVHNHVAELRRRFPRDLNVIVRPSGFPTIQILQSGVEDALHHLLVTAISNGNTSIIRLPYPLAPIEKHELQHVLSEPRVDGEVFQRVMNMFADKTTAAKNLLLVRGLLVDKILFLCLRKRWHVQYGLHPDRHPIAVPYEAKGVPSEQAEFGHPDVAILLTCLAFYHTGLSMAQLKQSLGHVLTSDDPASEYDRWTADCESLPGALRHWNFINVDDEGQVTELWRHLRYNTTVLDHYMNAFVFPLHAKQFAVKLQSSAWDLPLFSTDTEEQHARTTGFSGTNDNRRLLPLTIEQHDLPSLEKTNAEVLTYLLQDRNRRYVVAADSCGIRLSEQQLLRDITKHGIRVFIDAGASIIELDNRSLVKTWLDIDTQAQAAVYIGDNDNRAWVQYRGGKEPVPLLATPFANNLDQCLIYLDEAHTRGTDLKLPRTAWGAVTLALRQTKDHTVQAAMRLRQLATTQSVVFFAPPEVHQSILDVCQGVSSHEIDSSHVVRWLLEQTCRSNEQLQALYTAQGLDFCHRLNGALQYPDILDNNNHRSVLLNLIKSPERLTLEEQYGVSTGNRLKALEHVSNPCVQGLIKTLMKQRKATEFCKLTIYQSAMEEVEQEREVENQVEETREIQRPTHHRALNFPGLHPDILDFIATGILKANHAFQLAMSFLSRTKLGMKFKLDARPRAARLLVSLEFTRTVRPCTLALDDNFLRPVEYVLWSIETQTALVIVPEEVELIIPILRMMESPPVHLISYAAPMTRNMFHFCCLDYYALPCLPQHHAFPEWLSTELGILGGRLYFTFAEYEPLRKHLDALAAPSSQMQEALPTRKFIAFLFDWLSVRRKSQDITLTPMGYLCTGKALHETHPFFGAAAREEDIVTAIAESNSTSPTNECNSSDSEPEHG